MRFVDTNVLLYAISTSPGEEKKRTRALEILNNRDLALSVQVLQEFYVQATHSGRKDRLSHSLAVGFIESWLRFYVQEINLLLMQKALSTTDRWRISYSDSLIVEAARAAGCD